MNSKLITQYHAKVFLLNSIYIPFLCIAITLSSTVFAAHVDAPYAQHPSAIDEGVINGAGAHFSWLIFNALKPDLEKASGRKINLFGKDSMLGQGCNAGIKSAKLDGEKTETFGFICCPLSQKEINKKQINVYPIALEPILILLNQANPVKDLSSQQVRDIFSGKIINWQEVGGKDQPIVVITRLHCKKRPGHWKTILPNKDQFRQQRINVASADDMVQRISDFPGSIGHTGATWEFGAKDEVKHITVDSIEPNGDSLAAKTYPFYRQLSAVTDNTPAPDVLKIITEVQTGPAFFKFAKKFRLLPLNKARQ